MICAPGNAALSLAMASDVFWIGLLYKIIENVLIMNFLRVLLLVGQVFPDINAETSVMLLYATNNPHFTQIQHTNLAQHIPPKLTHHITTQIHLRRLT